MGYFVPGQSVPMGVLPDRRQEGIYSLQHGGAKAQILADIRTACETFWQCDAHFTTYFPVGPQSIMEHVYAEGWPRINKVNSTVISELRARDCDLVTQLLVFDYDNPNHQPWEHREKFLEWAEGFVAAIQSPAKPTPESPIVPALPFLDNWACIYSTKGGARIIYILSQPICVTDAESHHRWMVSTFKDRGVMVDPNCSDWTRIFRLPQVLRDGTNSTLAPAYCLAANWDARLPIELLGRQDTRSVLPSRAASEYLRETKPRPASEEAAAYTRVMSEAGRWVESDFFKRAKIELRGRQCFGCIFNGEALAMPGARDATMFKYVGQAAGVLMPRMPGLLPIHLYSLFLPAVESLEVDDSSPASWEDKLWDVCNRLWAAEMSKAEALRLRREEESREAVDKLRSLLEKMREWCSAPELSDLESQEGFQQAAQWVGRRSLVVNKRAFYVLQPSGYYSPYERIDTELVPHIRSRGLDWLIPTRVVDEKTGQYRDRSVPSILGAHAIDIVEVELRPGKTINAYFSDLESSIRKPKLVISPYARNPEIRPEYSKDVDEWLQVLFGVWYPKMTKEWIPHALAFEEGAICALSIKGTEGVGKKLLVRGLLECLCDPTAADANDLLGEYQYGLLRSPFVVIDEGWPIHSGRQSHNAADVFRRLVAGGEINANTKFGHPVKVAIAPRIIMTANNDSMMEIFNRTQATTIEDQKALAIRILHIEVNEEARNWLTRKGGLRFTGRPGAKWIRPDGSSESSDFVLAKHFMWLYAQRGAATGRRLLVDGESDLKTLDRFRTATSPAQTMMLSIARTTEIGAAGTVVAKAHLPPGFKWHKDLKQLQVSIKAVERACEDYAGSRHGRADTRLRVGEIWKHLPSICLSMRETLDERGMFPLDLGLIIRFCDRVGQPCEGLRSLLNFDGLETVVGSPFVGLNGDRTSPEFRVAAGLTPRK